MTPPPPKTEADRTHKRKPAAEKKAIEKKPALTEKKVEKPQSKEDGPVRIRAILRFTEANTEGPTGNPQLVVMAPGAHDGRPCPVDVGGPGASTNPAYGPSDPRGRHGRAAQANEPRI